ncbi:aroma-sacti cluster domain-containing protein [Streptacidiphilus sp. P02-A3a]|uniref:aroma-sacti cluster domain-containing protein n=1 Tax=Streptacidiphilus sp. P02-A3a TaxID=2704468 RepID=UPI0015FC0BBD|nr:aroma-sacti cluster domain-containing protein [Streptacidiphilus sp. P02-A3a]QMU73240.1 hypothetical protein GXP74_38440 [Streptacidiphilus sp. P02-A3a]
MTVPDDHPDRSDPLARLRDAGFDLDAFDDDQLDLLAGLSTDELTVLLDIRERIGEVRPEVELHGHEMPMTIGGLLF